MTSVVGVISKLQPRPQPEHRGLPHRQQAERGFFDRAFTRIGIGGLQIVGILVFLCKAAPADEASKAKAMS
jgi:hypothetical protein